MLQEQKNSIYKKKVGSVPQMSLMISLKFYLRMLCFLSSNRSLKDIHSSSGQCNPAFQPTSAKNSPKYTRPRIGEPAFLESSANVSCKPLFAQTVPSRPAPLVSLFICQTVEFVFHTKSVVIKKSFSCTASKSATTNQISTGNTSPKMLNRNI